MMDACGFGFRQTILLHGRVLFTKFEALRALGWLETAAKRSNVRIRE